MTYAIVFKNRLNPAPRYLTKVRRGYPEKTTDIAAAATFRTKADARAAVASIGKNNLYHTEVEIIKWEK